MVGGPPSHFPTFTQALVYWLKLGCISFGGPAGQIALMQHELVDRRGWIDQTRFLHALNFCMLLPGPEAQQLATFIGWRMHGIAGGLAAGILFVVPGMLVLWALSWLAAAHGDTGPVAAVFSGIKPVVVAIIVHAVWRVGRRALKGAPAVALAAAAFVALFVFAVPFPLVILTAALAGIAASLADRHWFALPHGAGGDDNGLPAGPPPSLTRLAVLALVFLTLWAVPVLAVVEAAGQEPFRGIAALFTKAAFVTFGGAYAVLPYIAHQAVHVYGWLTPAEMVNGLALAETTPGPLILVTQYVGFFAGWNQPGDGSPLGAATLGAALTTYVTFLPCFFFIFAGAPYVERLIHVRWLTGALAAITAAVVGVVLNLGVFLGAAVIVPEGRLDLFAAVVALAALGGLARFGLAVHWAVLAGAALGVARLAVG
ncbi:MAG TPA: chromate efflux transporter [Azospirillaceae bacterium]|nr:chromate efflux transporter [Azospirillaceae bacterium]